MLASIRCGRLGFDRDAPREFSSQRQLGAFNAIDPRVAARPAVRNQDFDSGNKAQVHEMFCRRRFHFQLLEYCAFSDVQIGQGGP